MGQNQQPMPRQAQVVVPQPVPQPRIPAGFDNARMNPHECPVFFKEKGKHFYQFVDLYMSNPERKALSDSLKLLMSINKEPVLEAIAWLMPSLSLLEHCHRQALELESSSGDMKTLYPQLIHLYTTSYYYREMNYCLRVDNPDQMEALAPLIFHSREAFRSDTCILNAFEGQMFRGLCGLSHMQVAGFIPESEFFFPAFTSGSTDKDCGDEFAKQAHWTAGQHVDGNFVTLEIRCYGLEAKKLGSLATTKAWYVPCDVQPASINPASMAEIVIPPYTKFRVVNVLKKDDSTVHVWLETIEFPSVWESINKLDLEQFSKFAEGNPDVVAAHGCENSIVNKLAENACQRLEDAQRLGQAAGGDKDGSKEDMPDGDEADGKELSLRAMKSAQDNAPAHGCENCIVNKLTENACQRLEDAQRLGQAAGDAKHWLEEDMQDADEPDKDLSLRAMSSDPENARCEDAQNSEFAEVKVGHEDMRDEANKELSWDFMERAAGMLQVCAKVGANVNEVDPQNGMTPLYRVAKAAVAIAAVAPGAQEALENVMEVANVLVKCGANPFMKLDKIIVEEDRGKCVHELIGDRAPGLKKVMENSELFPHVWEYWVDDKVDGKADGWYPYHGAASPQVDASFVRWRAHDAESVMQVHSGIFEYTVDFANMKQKNTKTAKCRKIRRKVSGDRLQDSQ